MEATDAYRKVLSEAEDHSVVISSIGFVTNLAALLQTNPDQYSSLNGYDLVAAKVKTIVWQGGWYPPTHAFGHHTYNWDCGSGYYNTTGCNGASEFGINNMPPSVEMIYSDIGDAIISGKRLSYCANERNPCRAALEDQVSSKLSIHMTPYQNMGPQGIFEIKFSYHRKALVMVGVVGILL